MKKKVWSKYSLFNFFALKIMIHKYYYLFTRPSQVSSFNFFRGEYFGWGALGAETLCLSGVKICTQKIVVTQKLQ